MQRIAREFNISETVFVFEPDDPAHTCIFASLRPAGSCRSRATRPSARRSSWRGRERSRPPGPNRGSSSRRASARSP
jgi:hypothetical protein